MIEESQIIWGVGLGILAIMMMTGFIIVFVILYQRRQLAQEKQLFQIQKDYQQGLLATALDSEEAERRRIAQDLHDDIGVMLSLTKMSMNQLQVNLKKQQATEEPSLLKAKSLLDETITHVRKITRELVPTTLEQFGLEAAIEEFAGKLDQSSGLTIFFNESQQPLPRQSQKTELSLFRIVQELVNNAVKHARCSEIHIGLRHDSSQLFLTIRDNGIGFDATAMQQKGKGGLGLRNIESRLSIVHGQIKYTSLTPGSLAEIIIPLSGSH